MTDPNFIILYVDNPTTSTTFYTNLLGKGPIEASPTFAMFALDSGIRLGLWSKHDVEPVAIATGGGSELVFAVASNDMVNAMHTEWCSRELAIAQAPTHMDFGYTFVAIDPDGHRLRVYARPNNA
ncbi:MAG: VOC family protein [Burkholderiaceae bacterium]